jgi:ABC-type uncharacterized transport system substrate-binding protein
MAPGRAGRRRRSPIRRGVRESRWSSFVHLRSVVKTPVNRVGVVHRPRFRHFIEHQKQLAAKEQIDLVTVEVGNEIDGAHLRSALQSLIGRQKLDAIWMLNDNELIKNAAFLDQTWRAELRRARIPLVVGVPNLVDPETPLGSFAVVPDHEALGLQTANIIFDLADNDWKAACRPRS